MNEFTVTVDRTRDQLRVATGRVYLPYAREGQLWSDLERASKATPNGNLSPEAQDLIDFATAVFHLDKICLRGERELQLAQLILSFFISFKGLYEDGSGIKLKFLTPLR